MQASTGAIAHFENDEDAQAAGYTLPLDVETAEWLLGLSRAERRKWALEQVRSGALRKFIDERTHQELERRLADLEAGNS